jgi:hypothetical protein
VRLNLLAGAFVSYLDLYDMPIDIRVKVSITFVIQSDSARPARVPKVATTRAAILGTLFYIAPKVGPQANQGGGLACGPYRGQTFGLGVRWT